MIDVKDLKARNLQAIVVVNKASKGGGNKSFSTLNKFSKIFSTLIKFDIIIPKKLKVCWRENTRVTK